MNLVKSFNALHDRHVADDITVIPASAGKQTLKVSGSIAGTDHRFTYFSLEHDPEDLHEALAYVSTRVVDDHGL